MKREFHLYSTKDGSFVGVTEVEVEDNKPPPLVLPYPKEIPRPSWDDPEGLQAWTLAQLDAMDKAVAREEDLKNLPMIGVPNRPWVTKPKLADLQPKERAIAEADYYGNIEPLRKLYPELARFLFPPKLKPGQHFKPFGDGDQWDLRARLRGARADMSRIRAIWKAAYDGKCNRSGSQMTAADIAAKRWGVPANTVRSGLLNEAARQRKNEARRRSRKKP
ncbi:MAG: hypothetical protein WAR76_01450 [Xanthobacteraceae bacterium]